MTDLLESREELKLSLGSQCKIPDHSVMLSQFYVPSQSNVSSNSTPQKPNTCRKYSFNNPNVNFFNNAAWWKTVIDAINDLEQKTLVSEEFDKNHFK